MRAPREQEHVNRDTTIGTYCRRSPSVLDPAGLIRRVAAALIPPKQVPIAAAALPLGVTLAEGVPPDVKTQGERFVNEIWMENAIESVISALPGGIIDACAKPKELCSRLGTYSPFRSMLTHDVSSVISWTPLIKPSSPRRICTLPCCGYASLVGFYSSR
jgi:hypothetical protein